MHSGFVGTEPAPQQSRLDVVVALVLFAGTLAYLSTLPRILGPSDEGLYLYNAKRVLDGDVLYRDIYDIITPASHYLMALAYGRGTIEQRLAGWLLAAAERLDTDWLSITHDTLSQVLGARRASVTVALHMLEGKQALRRERSRIRILNNEKLALAAGPYST